MSSNKPFPSSDLDVFKENSLILDNFVNSQDNEYPDRFNRKRPTITGIIKEAFNVRTDISNMNEVLIGQSRWDVVPKNTSLSLGGDNGALNKQAQALFNRTVMLKIHSREALRRTYQEAGYNLVEGSFEQGGTLVNANDVMLHEASGKAFSGPLGTVAAGTNPISAGFTDESNSLLHSALSGVNGAELVRGAVKYFETASEMQSVVSSVGRVCETLGYASAGDGGGATYTIVAPSPSQIGDVVLTNGNVARVDISTVKSPRQLGYGNTAVSLSDCLNKICERYPATMLDYSSQAATPVGNDFRSSEEIPQMCINPMFDTWRRFDARGISEITAMPPTFGDAATYEGTGGLRTYHADMWFSKQYGLYGSNVTKRRLASGYSRGVTQSDYYVSWIANSVTPPPAKVIANSSITSAASSPVTVTTSTPFGLVDGDWVHIKGTESNAGSIDGTYQVSGVSGSSFTIAIAPLSGFVAWLSIGNSNNDPDSTGYEHVYDPAIGNVTNLTRNWIRNGSSGHELSCRVPVTSLVSGKVTARIRAKSISGHAGFYLRIFQDFGVGGSPTTSNTSSLITLTDSPSEYLLQMVIPELGGASFGKLSYLQVSIVPTIFDPNFEIEVYSVEVYPSASVPKYPKPYNGADAIYKKHYRTARSAFLGPVTDGRFYGVNVSFSDPMYRTPTVNIISGTGSLMGHSSFSGISSYGVTQSLTATGTGNVGSYTGVLEFEAVIPT